ncbi:tRNA methyl transferase [Halteromyces radiatus]|uniref:tRNA methyl transferase n=1 Tax=Halteromyces radiatus TaxID=101107 RepID=UPI00221E6068|nr:tRNA methyl transferase [Halteromyces radiatus]KAI8086131.1 tRNA methyl transferase [Halteromyces radiatus]
MSGGVDSSVSAALLKQQGFNVEGFYMKNWDTRDERGVCPSEQDWQDVQQVCKKLDIPCTQVDFVKDYWHQVFQDTLDDYAAGLTPNPDVMCNQHIKFGSLLNRIPEDCWLATGHYCRTDGYGRLLRGKEVGKDQSYYLSTVPYTALQRTLFPLGEFTSKEQVKQLAHTFGFDQVATKRESYGICFVGQHRKFADFLAQYIDQPRGQAVDLETGKIIGEHQGLFGYTIGQAAHIHHGPHKWFVAEKDMTTNTLYCVPGSTHPSLFHKACIARHWTWIHTYQPSHQSSSPVNLLAQVRYRQQPQPAQLTQDPDGRYRVTFDQPIRAMAKGQQVVVWEKDWCLGSGVIDEIIPAYSLV